MKPLTQSEFQTILAELRSLAGAFLQEIQAAPGAFGLGLFHSGRLQWLWFDLDPTRPLVLKLDKPPHASKKPIPLVLFLRAHARGRKLTQVTTTDEGRVGQLLFGEPPDACEFEFRLFPHGQNLLARMQKSQV